MSSRALTWPVRIRTGGDLERAVGRRHDGVLTAGPEQGVRGHWWARAAGAVNPLPALHAVAVAASGALSLVRRRRSSSARQEGQDVRGGAVSRLEMVQIR